MAEGHAGAADDDKDETKEQPASSPNTLRLTLYCKTTLLELGQRMSLVWRSGVDNIHRWEPYKKHESISAVYVRVHERPGR